MRAQFSDGLDDALPVRIFAAGRSGRRLRRLREDLRQRQLDFFVAGGAAAARFGVVDHLFKGGQAVVLHRAANVSFIDAEAFADQLALLMLLLQAFAAKVGDGRAQGLLAHHRAVHFLRR